ncbi:AfsR/SARP family transcriptional regulator [Paractinoplanes deccanensis]|uniref:AfsR/SARP family transcriptional regulator n=1 Tax=Paractinoplanes deccanensis TaxID=113561 RepID=UPI0034DB5EC8
MPFRPPQARALLAVLLTRVGRPVSIAEIVDILWGPSAPDTAPNAVHGHVSTLRRLLEPGLPARERGRSGRRSCGRRSCRCPRPGARRRRRSRSRRCNRR